MKIALVIERMEPWRGGAETSTQQYSHKLRDAGCEVHVVTASRGQPEAGMQLHMLPGWGTRAGFTRRFAQQARQLVLGERFDVVHSIAPLPGANLFQPRGGTLAETVQRNLDLLPPSARPLKRLGNLFNGKQQLLLRMEREVLTHNPRPIVVAISNYVARQLDEHYHFPADRIRHVFNAVDVPLYDGSSLDSQRQSVREHYGLTNGETLLLCVAHNFRLKGVGTLIAALPLVRQLAPQLVFKLLIVGRDNPAPFQRQAERAGVAPFVQFIGSTPRMTSFYHAADMLVHPTFYDPCSRVVLEALAAGLPCITTKMNGASEIMTDGRHGCVLPDAQSPAALADAIVKLAGPAQRQACANATKELAPQLSLDHHVAGMLAVYQEIVRDGPTVEQMCSG